jgi:hypothetical protein
MPAFLLFLGPLLELFGKIPGAVFNLPFGSIFSGIGSFLKALIANIIHYWYVWLIVILLSSNGFTYWRWQVNHTQLIKEVAAFNAQAASFKAAQAAATSQANAERALLQKESKADADQADANYATLLSQYNANLLRYRAGQSGTQQSGNNQLPAPQGSDGPSTGPQLPTEITISGSDAEICAFNTARLQAVHDWAVTLPTKVQTP